MKEKSKKALFLSLEKEEFLELKKILFRKGLSVQEFISFVVHKCAMHDDSVESFYNEALQTKEKTVKKGSKIEGTKLDDIDLIYNMIEEHLQGKKDETPKE